MESIYLDALRQMLMVIVQIGVGVLVIEMLRKVLGRRSR